MKLVKALLSWHIGSQLGARRNALTAATALAQRRLERLEADEYVARCLARRAVRDRREGAS